MHKQQHPWKKFLTDSTTNHMRAPMHLHRLAMTAFALFTFVIPRMDDGFSDEKALKARIFKEYSPALKKLREKNVQCFGKGAITTEKKDSKTGNWAGRTSAMSFFFDGSSGKVAKSSVESPDKGHTKWNITCVNPVCSFRVERSEEGRVATLTSMVPGRDPSLVKSFMVFRCEGIDAPFSTPTYRPLEDIVNDPTFRILKVRSEDRAGLACLRIEFTRIMHTKKADYTIEGWFVVAPEEGWLLCEQGQNHAGVIRTSAIEYARTQSGDLVPKKVRTEEPNKRTTVEFDEFTRGPSPDFEFTLGAVGLPELDKPASPRQSNFVVIYFIIAGLICALIAAFLTLTRRERREGKRSS